MADILFVHNNFPGQFGHLAWALRQRGHRVVAIAAQWAGSVPGVPVAKYEEPAGAAARAHPWAQRAELEVRRAQAGMAQAVGLQQQGFDPKLIIAHPAWGDVLGVREVFPGARQIMHGELYLPAEGGDIGFDPEMGPWTVADRVERRLANLGLALAYVEADAIVCPTPWQAATFPDSLQPRIRVIHEGIDAQDIQPDPQAVYTLPDGRALGRGTPLITFIARKLEPLRGFHILMRALPTLLAGLPSAQVLIIGQEGHGYGFRPAPPEGWKARYLGEVKGRVDLARVHFTGKLPHPQMLTALKASAAHVYYSYPYVLSWSLLEAMAAGALVLASDTAPVRDVIAHGQNGLLGDFFDAEGLARRLITVCNRPEDFQRLRDGARRTALERYDRDTVCLPAWLALVEDELRRA